jgi:hypothetical protein
VIYSIQIPEDEVDGWCVRHLSVINKYEVYLGHRYGSVFDNFGRVLYRASGSAIEENLNDAVRVALANLRKAVRDQLEEQNARPPAALPTLTKDNDVQELLDLLDL